MAGGVNPVQVDPDAGIPDLIHRLTDDSKRLMSDEVRLAKLEVKEVKKGDVKPGESVLVTWRAVPKSIDGPWTVYYYPGEVVWTHLTKRSNGATYASTWLNAKSEIVTSPDSKELPTELGETVTPPLQQKPQTPL